VPLARRGVQAKLVGHLPRTVKQSSCCSWLVGNDLRRLGGGQLWPWTRQVTHYWSTNLILPTENLPLWQQDRELALQNKLGGLLGRVDNIYSRFQARRAPTMHRHAIADEHWDRIRDFLPGQAGDPGVTAKDNRLFVDAVLWIGKTGAPWRDIPERFGK